MKIKITKDFRKLCDLHIPYRYAKVLAGDIIEVVRVWVDGDGMNVFTLKGYMWEISEDCVDEVIE